MDSPRSCKLVIVHWEDIQFNDNWDDDNPVQPVECVTVGFLVKDEATFVGIASSYDYREEQWATKHAIPRGVVQSIEVLREPSD